MTLPDWSSPFAPPHFHEVSALLRTCPPLTNAHRLLLALQFVLLVPFHPLLFRTPWRTCRRFYLFNWLGLCQVLLLALFSLCKCLAFSIPYIMQPIPVYNRCTLSQHATECCFRCKMSSFRYLIEGSLAFNSLTLT